MTIQILGQTEGRERAAAEELAAQLATILFCANRARTATEKEVVDRAWRMAVQYRDDATKLGAQPDIGEKPPALAG